eukprot:TRINITY_DN4548_c0_g1_i1.p1 TRINITY_DN4548_c0_g1~~TRINITY_DN4548_c0_g1_i1.p1  ORF type:complete len:2012 (+),score=806.97 TRINITY_DN4548_c0_g1_i1:33-6038(+)
MASDNRVQPNLEAELARQEKLDAEVAAMHSRLGHDSAFGEFEDFGESAPAEIVAARQEAVARQANGKVAEMEMQKELERLQAAQRELRSARSPESDGFSGMDDQLSSHVHSPETDDLDNADSYNNNDTDDINDKDDDLVSDQDEDPLTLSHSSVPPGQSAQPQWAAFEDYKRLHEEHLKLQHDHTQLQDDYQDLEARVQAMQQDRDDLIQVSERLALENAELKQEQAMNLTTVEDLETDVEHLTQQLEAVQEAGGKVVHKHTTTTHNVTEIVDKYEAELDTLRQEMATLIEQHEMEIDALHDAMEEMDSDSDTESSPLVTKLRAENDELKRQLAAQGQAAAAGSPTSSDEVRVQDAMVAQLEAENRDLKVEMELLQAEKAASTDMLDQASAAELSAKQSELMQQLEAQNAMLMSELEQLQTLADKDAHQVTLQQLEAENAELRNTLAQLEKDQHGDAQLDRLEQVHEQEIEALQEQHRTTTHALRAEITTLNEEIDELHTTLEQAEVRYQSDLDQHVRHRQLPTPGSSAKGRKSAGSTRKRPAFRPGYNGGLSSKQTDMRKEVIPFNDRDLTSLNKMELLQLVDFYDRENIWLFECQADAHARLAAAPEGRTQKHIHGLPSHIEDRARRRRSKDNIHKLRTYLRSLGCPGQASTWTQVNTLYNHSMELETRVDKQGRQLDKLVPEVEQARSLLRCTRTEPLTKPIQALQDRVSSLQTDLTVARRELSAERATNAQALSTLKEQLSANQEQAEHDLDLLKDQLTAQERRSRAELLARDKETLNSLVTATERSRSTGPSPSPAPVHLAVPRSTSKPSNSTSSNTYTSRSVPTTPRRRAQSPGMTAPHSARPRTANSTASASSSRPTSRGRDLERSQGQSPAALETSSRIDELVDMHAAQLDGLRQQIKQERQAHQEEVAALEDRLQDVQRGHEQVLARHRSELAQMRVAQHSDVDGLLQERNRLREELVVAESTSQRVQSVADETHSKVMDVEAQFESELIALQGAMSREHARHAQEVDRLKADRATLEEHHAQQLEAALDQLTQCESQIQYSQEEIERLQTTLRQAQSAHATELAELRDQLEGELATLRTQHDLELRQQAAELQEVYQSATYASQRATPEVQEEIDATLGQLRGEMMVLRESKETERQMLINKHEAQLTALESSLAKARSSHAQELHALENDHQLLLQEMADTRESVLALQLALKAKEQELTAAREAFVEERDTFALSLSRLETQTEEMTEEAHRVRQLHTTEVADLTATISELRAQLQQAQDDLRLRQVELESKAQELTYLQQRATAERDDLNATLMADVTRERQARRVTEETQAEKLRAVSDERDDLRRKVQVLQGKLTAQQSEANGQLQAVQRELSQRKLDLEDQKYQAEQQQRDHQARLHKAQLELDSLRAQLQRLCMDTAGEDDLNTSAMAERSTTSASDYARVLARQITQQQAKLAVLQTENTELTGNMARLRAQHDRLKATLDATQDESSQLRSAERSVRETTTQLEVRVSVAEEENMRLQQELDETRHKLNQAKQQVSESTTRAQHGEGQFAALIESIQSGFETEKQNFHAQVANLRHELEAAQAQSTELRGQLRAAEARHKQTQMELSTLGADRDALQAQLDSQRQRGEDGERRANGLQQHTTELQGQVASLQQEVASVNRKYDELQAEASNLQRITVELQDRNRELEEQVKTSSMTSSKLTATSKEVERLERQLGSAHHDLSTVTNELDDLRKQRDRLQQEVIQARSVNKREKDSHATIVADLERQLQVAKARYEKERGHVSQGDVATRQLRDEIARLQRALDASKQQTAQAEAQQLQTELSLKEKERALASTKKRVEALTAETQRLAEQRRALEERTRRDQSRLLADVQAQLHSHDDALRSVARLRDSSTLGGNARGQNYDRRLAHLGTQVRRLGADLRQERFDRESSILSHSTHANARATTPTATNTTQYGNTLAMEALSEGGQSEEASVQLTSTMNAQDELPEGSAGLPDAIENVDDEE